MKTLWNKAKIGDVCSLMTGGTPSRNNEAFFGGNIKWLVSGDIHQKEIFDCEGRITESGLNNSSARLLPINSVMIALNGQGKTKGTVALLRTLATCNQSLVSILPNNQKQLLPEFLYANLHGRYQEIRRLTGDDDKDRRGLNMPLIRNIEIPLPPIHEQQRIVAILDEAFDAIAAARANAEQNRQNARALFESYLQSVFSQRGNGWVEKTLGDIGKVSMCKRVLKEQTSAIGDIPFYKIGSFGKKADSFISTELYSQYKEKYSFPKKGDILLSAAGTIGRRVIFDGNDAYFQDSNIVWIANDQTQVLNCFLYHFYGACEWNATKGATILRLYNEDLRRIVIAFPTSLDVQKSIAAQMDLIFDATQRLESLYQRKIAALDELKQSLLQQAFSGQL
ncbi:restriction endonuclease subunit S [Aeromonas dhakensis]|uniref:restriction endonuclease subunit S n=1 Tax=Aeromonas TaxID=642 RepID=UPI00300DD246